MILDIMANKQMDCPVFIAENTALYKPLYPGQGYTGLLHNAYNQTLFTSIDHITVLSIGCVLPLGYQWFNNPNDEPVICELITRQVISGLETTLDKYYLPFENYEMSIGKFYELGNNYQTNYELLLKMVAVDGVIANISQINGPAALNAQTLRAFMFAKIQHNIPISTIP